MLWQQATILYVASIFRNSILKKKIFLNAIILNNKSDLDSY